MNDNAARRLFVLDTNVLMHDPTSLFRFHEHDVFLPMVVLEELDRHKQGRSELARNTRQASRFLEDLVRHASHGDIIAGLELGRHSEAAAGRLFIQTQELSHPLPASLPGNPADHTILSTALALCELHPEREVTLVSKDINLRIKAAALGLRAEDYQNDQVLEDVNLLYSGRFELPEAFWEALGDGVESWHEEARTFYRIRHPQVAQWHPGQFIHSIDHRFQAVVRRLAGEEAVLEVLEDYRGQRDVWGIHARNPDQNFALNVLLDPQFDFVTLVGMAGTGKTLLALAAALTQTLEHKRYHEIIMTRVTVPVGEDIGFLPGTEEEKMTPWMGALMDNLEVLTGHQGTEWERAATRELVHDRIKIRSLNFMRGRTFHNRFLILDEAQNLTSKQMKTLITRAGPGTKVVCLGNIAQIDTPYLTETTSGLTYVVDRFKDWPHAAHIILQRGERSRLSDYASEIL